MNNKPKLQETNLEDFSYEELQDGLKKVIENFESAIDKFPHELRNVTLFDKWSLQDILTHFSGWNQVTIWDVGCVLNGNLEAIRWIEDEAIDIFNAEEVNRRKLLSWDEVCTEFITTIRNLYNAYLKVPKEKQQANMNGGFTIRESLIVDIQHFQLHLREIEAKLAELGNES